jgi:hypothetical protein
MRVLRLLVLLLLTAPAFANQAASGFCETGGAQVSLSGLLSTTLVQQSFPSCTVTVRLVSNGSIATIYSDNANTPLANPFTASAQGYWTFYAANTRYSVSLTNAGISGTIFISDILLNDPSGGGGVVTSVFGRTGTVIAVSGDYNVSQITGAAPLASPALTGVPTAPTATFGDATTQIATDAFVQAAIVGNGVASVFGRTGVVVAVSGDYTVSQITGAAPAASPTFTGSVTISGLSNGCLQIAAGIITSTGSACGSGGGGGAVSSVFTRTGAVTAQSGDYTVSQITGAAPLASPTFTGSPVAPTPSLGDNSTRIATTAYVQGQGYQTNALTGSGTANSVAKYTGTSVLSNSLITDDGTTMQYAGSGGITLPATGPAAFVGLGTGSAAGITAGIIGLQAPTSGGGYNLYFPISPATGYIRWTNASSLLQGTFRTVVDLVGSTLDLTAQSGSLSTQTLVSSTPSAGRYSVVYYIDESAGCSSADGTVLATFFWTDATHARQQASTTLTFAATVGTGNFLQGAVRLWAAASTAITATTTYSACGTGAATYDIHTYVTEAQ